MAPRDVSREQPEGFEAVDHTADVGLRVWAGSLEGLFAQAARGLAWLLTDPERVERRRRIALKVRGLDLEELLVAWLNEILYRAEAERLILVGFEGLRISRENDQYRLEAVGIGEPRDERRHPARAGVKAATYHNLRVSPGAGGRYDVTIILDT